MPDILKYVLGAASIMTGILFIITSLIAGSFTQDGKNRTGPDTMAVDSMDFSDSEHKETDNSQNSNIKTYVPYERAAQKFLSLMAAGYKKISQDASGWDDQLNNVMEDGLYLTFDGREAPRAEYLEEYSDFVVAHSVEAEILFRADAESFKPEFNPVLAGDITVNIYRFDGTDEEARQYGRLFGIKDILNDNTAKVEFVFADNISENTTLVRYWKGTDVQ